ncbi:MAG: NAD(P)-binding domain-containing protein, partial [Pseudomonadota bacterium]
MPIQTAVFGLGSMGLGMAQSLHRAGVDTHGFDPDAARQAGFAEESGN